MGFLSPSHGDCTMSRSHKVLGFLFVALLGVYGCARGPIEPNGAKPSAAEVSIS